MPKTFTYALQLFEANILYINTKQYKKISSKSIKNTELFIVIIIISVKDRK